MKARKKSNAARGPARPALRDRGLPWSADGRLAATLAHEVNNSLDTIHNCLHLLSGRVRTRGAPAYELLRAEAARLGRLVREILGLYRNAPPAAPTDLNAAVREALHALQPRLRRAKVRVTNSAGKLPRVLASPVLLRLLVSNLITNAAAAMPAGGKLRVETRRLPASRRPASPAGRRLAHTTRVRLRVADTGTGIPPRVAARIFQPFVTSKGERGTGLGLWIVAQIVTHHGGRVRALPRPGRGTVMEVELPTRNAKWKMKNGK